MRSLLDSRKRSIDYYQQSLAIARQICDRLGEANAWFNSGIVLAKLSREQDAIGAYRNAREHYQAMGLDTNVQSCDAAIQRLERVSLAADIPVRNPIAFWAILPRTAIAWVWRWVRQLGQLVRDQVRLRSRR